LLPCLTNKSITSASPTSSRNIFSYPNILNICWIDIYASGFLYPPVSILCQTNIMPNLALWQSRIKVKEAGLHTHGSPLWSSHFSVFYINSVYGFLHYVKCDGFTCALCSALTQLGWLTLFLPF